jgi:hypothetical protein
MYARSITANFMIDFSKRDGTFFSGKGVWLYAMLLQALLLLSLPCLVSAGPVEVEIIKGEAIVGENLAFTLKFDVDSDEELIDVSQVQYKGVPIPYEVTSRSTSSFTMIINGKTVQSSSGLVKNYVFTLPADQVGPLELPACTVSVGDKQYKIKSLSFTVTERPTSDNLRFLVEIDNPQAYYYPSQVIDVSCTLLYRNFKGSPSIENITLPILKNLSFELLPDDNPDFELIINGQRQAVKQKQGTQMFQGLDYNFLTFHLKFRIMNHGDFNFNNSLKMVVETGRTFRKPSIFFGYDVGRETEPVFADSAPLHFTVRQLPQENVPSSFNGAIGNFKIKVTPSSDTAIRVGDPITLHIEISGRGTWEFVKSPPLDRNPQITDYFIVSNEPVAGEVNEDKTVKSFSVRLRVKSKTVKEIPAIPFTYFNLAARKYQTVYSEPIPLHVFDAAASAKITDFGAPSPEQEEQNPSNKISRNETRADNTTISDQNRELKPQLPPLIEITDNVPSDQTTKNNAPKYGQLMFAVLPLISVFFFYLFTLYRDRDISADKRARLRAKKAYKQFETEIKPLSTRDADLATFCSELGRKIHQFMEDRFIRTFPYLNKETLLPLANEKKISPETAAEIMALIEKIDHYRYSSTTLGRAEAINLLEEAGKVLKKCD